MELFGVKELMDVQVRTLSLGRKNENGADRGSAPQPQNIVLDEPTIGLDAVAGRQVRKFLKEVNEEKGTTILLTSPLHGGYQITLQPLCGGKSRKQNL